MRRVAFVLTLVCAAAWSAAGLAQSLTKLPSIGVLSPGSAGANDRQHAMFRDRLRELGYVDGRTIAIHDRYANGRLDLLPMLARELVALKVDAIVAITVAASAAAREATGSIPIVMVHAGNPIGAGLIESLAHPGGNVTGTTSMLPELGAKQLELLRELLPRATRVAVLLNPTNQGSWPTLQNAAAAASALRFELVRVELSRAEDVEAALGAVLGAKADALLVSVESVIYTNRRRILDFTAQARLPALYSVSWLAREGGLLSYGTNIDVHYPRAAEYIDKLLRGADPAKLPVEQPTGFEMVVNLKTAKALGLTIPPSLLARADEVIE